MVCFGEKIVIDFVIRSNPYYEVPSYLNKDVLFQAYSPHSEFQ